MNVVTTGERTTPRRSRQEMPVRVSAKTDYALRAAAELAAANGDGLVKADLIAQAQGIPLKFLLNILNELKQDEIVRSQRGSEGGYRLARPADSITLGDVVRAVEGRLSTVRDAPPDEPGGWGLVLVESVSERWGSYPTHGGGKVVWAVLTP